MRWPGGSTPLAKYEDGTVHFLHRDALGSTRFLTNHFGTVRQDAIYYPWGQLWEWRTGDYDLRFAGLGLRRGFTAGDVEGTQDHTEFRFYGSRLYRWLSPDPLAGDILNPQSLNRYAYVMNNPVNAVDPLGLDGCSAQSANYPACDFAGENGWGPFGNCTLDGAPADCEQVAQSLAPQRLCGFPPVERTAEFENSHLSATTGGGIRTWSA